MMNSLKFGKLFVLLFLGWTSTIYSQESKEVMINEINGIWFDEGYATKDTDYGIVESSEMKVNYTITVDLEKMTGRVKSDGMLSMIEKIEIKEKGGIYWLDYTDRSIENEELKLSKIIELNDSKLIIHFENHDLIQFYSRVKN